MFTDLAARIHAGALAVDVPIPKPKAPDSGDILDKGSDAASWLSVRSGSFWIIIVVLIAAFLVAKALKKPLIKGILIGVILLAIGLAIAKGN